MANGDSENDPGSIRRGGGTPGSATSGGSEPSPGKAVPKSPRETGRVARNATNPVQLSFERLRVGWENNAPEELTRFRLWVPTNTGGDLGITHMNGGTVDLRRPYGKVVKAAQNHVSYEVKAGEFGEYFVVAKGKANSVILCTFIQSSFSRDGTGDSDPPLVPWNFWYWPTAKGNPYQKGAADIMARYGTAFGHDPEACRQAELDDHATKEVSGGDYDWEGHCHNAAPASALFEEPKPVTHNGQAFSEEEMKYLAAEYFGNFGHFQGMVWELKRGPSKPGGSSARWYLPGYFKPGTDMSRAALVDGLEREFQGNLALDDPKLVKGAEQTADIYVGALGGDAAFSKQMNEWMGELAAEFYQALIDYMRVKKHPLLANMRSYKASGGPQQVWNQVYFYYWAFYMEKEPQSTGVDPDHPSAAHYDDKDMVISCLMRANLDHHVDTSDLPARISGDDVIPTDGLSLVFKHLWRIQFDDAGKIIVQDPRNTWHYIHTDKDEPLYAPTELMPLDKLTTSRKSADKISLGNKFVGTELLDAGLLKVRKRYQ
jgi:hypothetical protein